MIPDVSNFDLPRAQWLIAGLVGGAAALEDLARRTVSNWIPVAALLSGLACQGLAGGWRGVGASLLGAAAGFAVFLVFYVLGGMGGGDVKLMAGFGAVLGVGRVAEAAFWTALVGGLLAAGALGVSWAWARAARRGAPGPVAIPYAPAIVAGVLLTLVGNK